MTAAARAQAARYLLLAVLVVLINFFLPRLLPGSPLVGAAGESTVALLPASAQAEIRRAYGLEQPLRVQFSMYLDGLRRGDLGRSLATYRPVTAMIAERLPWTVFLVGSSSLVAAALGAALGTAAAWRPRGPGARLAGPLLVGLGALPEVLVAMLLIVVLGIRVRLFPVGGAVTAFLSPGPGAWGAAAVDVLMHAALPGATLVVALAPAFFLLSRSALTGVRGAPYLLTAQGKGLSESRVLWHAWRNALPPVLTLVGLRLAFAVTGAALVERVFAYPGMGLLLFEAVLRRDYPVMQGVFLVASLVLLGVTAVLDLTASALDPRIRRPLP